MEPSDVMLAVDLVLAVALVAVFALGSRGWTRDPLGWVIFYYGLAVVALLTLIVYGVVFGQRVDEPFRFLVSVGLAVALSWKTWAIVRERRAAKRARMRMQSPTPDKEESRQ